MFRNFPESNYKKVFKNYFYQKDVMQAYKRYQIRVKKIKELEISK